jgi:hypothetical protein
MFQPKIAINNNNNNNGEDSSFLIKAGFYNT